MKIFRSKAALEQWLNSVRAGQQSIGFVPTMGALHEGHISLIQTAKTKAELVVCSIFVNPTQFNDKQDFEKYPVSTDQDVNLLTKAECDALFLPTVAEVYPDGTAGLEQFELGFLETVLDGAARPGHFQGVVQVVSRLLKLVAPDILFLGQKDFQQCLVLKKMVRDLGIPVQIETVPTMREEDGLAMSSRNRRLSESARAMAPLLYQCLVSIEAQQGVKPFAVVQKECWELLEHKGVRPDYIELADADSLAPLEDYDRNKQMVALIAAYVGDVRLIDNLVLGKVAH